MIKPPVDLQDLREGIYARAKTDLGRTRWSRDWPSVPKALPTERSHNPWREVIRKAECGKEQPTRPESSWCESSRDNCPDRSRSDATSRSG